MLALYHHVPLSCKFPIADNIGTCLQQPKVQTIDAAANLVSVVLHLSFEHMQAHQEFQELTSKYSDTTGPSLSLIDITALLTKIISTLTLEIDAEYVVSLYDRLIIPQDFTSFCYFFSAHIDDG